MTSAPNTRDGVIAVRKTHSRGARRCRRSRRFYPGQLTLLARRQFPDAGALVVIKQQPRQADKMPLRLAILALPALALVPTIAPPRAPRAAQLFSVVERGTSSLEDTEGLGAEFEDALVDDAAWDTEESGDEDLLAGFDLENVM